MTTVFRNANQGAISNLDISNGLVTNYDLNAKPELTAHEFVDYGLSALDKRFFDFVPIYINTSHGHLFNLLAQRKELIAFEASKPFFEIGSFQGLDQFKKFAKKCL